MDLEDDQKKKRCKEPFKLQKKRHSTSTVKILKSKMFVKEK